MYTIRLSPFCVSLHRAPSLRMAMTAMMMSAASATTPLTNSSRARKCYMHFGFAVACIYISIPSCMYNVR